MAIMPSPKHKPNSTFRQILPSQLWKSILTLLSSPIPYVNVITPTIINTLDKRKAEKEQANTIYWIQCLEETRDKHADLIKKLEQEQDRFWDVMEVARQADAKEKIKHLANFLLNGISKGIQVEEHKLYLNIIKELSVVDLVVFMVFRGNQEAYGLDDKFKHIDPKKRHEVDMSERTPSISKLLEAPEIKALNLPKEMVSHSVSNLSSKHLIKNPDDASSLTYGGDKHSIPIIGGRLYDLLLDELSPSPLTPQGAV